MRANHPRHHETRRTGIPCAPLLVPALLLVLAVVPLARADEPNAATDLLISTHTRLSFENPVERVAVADENIVTFELLNEREGLVLGKSLGRTTVMVWFANGRTESYLFHVRRDLSLLEEALREIHPSIYVRSAPDRDAVVLRGTVPDVSYANAAEEMAQRYLDARRGGRGTGGTPFLRAPGEKPSAEGEVPPAGPSVEPFAEVRSSAAVINLIRVESLPGRLEDRMQSAIQRLGTAQVTVTRLIRGRLPDDQQDIFVLRGRVETQADLIRVLSVAQSMLGSTGENAIRVRADESGALTGATSTGGGGAGSGFGGGSVGGLSGGSSGTSLRNLISSNVGRAKVIEAANGRILSFVSVSDLPQVRVDIRLYEVNSTKLRTFNSQLGILGSDFTQRGLNPARQANFLQGPAGAARVGGVGRNPEVQNVLSFLSGTLSNQFQLSTDHFALDSLLSLLEQRGFARSLSRPTLTVLSGERAFFQVGGEIPVPQSFATTATQSTEGVFNSVVFRPFGVQLSVRPLVGEGGDVTLDVAPQISLPDAQLTASVRQSTGSAQSTTAFRTRSLQTTAKLDDGQSLLVGGLITRNMTSTDSSTPGLSDTPLVGGLFSGYDREGDEFQLVVLVHPVVVRAPTNRARLWAYPRLEELVGSIGCR